jgi:hypothetical protein
VHDESATLPKNIHLFIGKRFFILQVYLQLNHPNPRLKAHFSTTSINAEVELLDDLLRGCHDVLAPDEA